MPRRRAVNPEIIAALHALQIDGLIENFIGPDGQSRWRLTAAGLEHNARAKISCAEPA